MNTKPVSEPGENLGPALASIFTSLLAAGNADAELAYELIKDHPAVASTAGAAARGDVAAFRFGLPQAFDQVIEGLLLQVLPASAEARFLLKNSGFVESQVRARIEAAEGYGCVADKTRFVMRSLLAFFQTGREISFNRNQQYTFHLPTRVLLTHQEVLEFFHAVRQLYHGNPAPYVAVLAPAAGTGA